MTTQQLQLPVASSSSSLSPSHCSHHRSTTSLLFHRHAATTSTNLTLSLSLNHHHRHSLRRQRHPRRSRANVEGRDPLFGDSLTATADDDEEDDEEDEVEPTADDLEYISQIRRVLDLLKKNRDMLFGEVKLTIMIEDPREVERKRLLGIDDSDGPTREDLVAALEDVNEGKVPRDRAALRLLAEEMVNWPNLEAEAPKKGKKKSLYAKATDTGIAPEVAAKRLNVDWDSAAEIAEAETTDETDVPAAVGFGALYIVTAFPVIIGISVVLILFYNSLQ